MKSPRTRDTQLTPVAERLAVELSLPALTTYLYCDRDSHIQLPASTSKENAPPDCAIARHLQRNAYGYEYEK